MIRTLVALVTLAAVAGVAVQPPKQEPLPNFDVRLTGQAARNAVAAEDEKAGTAVEKRVPQLKVTRSKVLGRPNYFASPSSFLSGPDGEGLAVDAARAKAFDKGDPHRSVKAFLNEHSKLIGYDASVLSTANVRRDFVTEHNNLRTVVWEQQIDGIPVFDGVIMGHITRRGELVNLYTHFVPNGEAARDNGMKGQKGGAKVSAEKALRIAAKNLGEGADLKNLRIKDEPAGAKQKQVFHGGEALKGDQYAELTWLPLSSSAVRLCWQVIVISKTLNAGYLMLVDAENGDVLLRRCLTTHISDATYNVYRSDSPSPFSPSHPAPSVLQPPIVPRVLVTTNAFSTNASPNGWINDGDNETRGNNVDAHGDLNDDDQPDLPRPQGNNGRIFDFPSDLTMDPTNFTSAAIVNLFYWNNVMHDVLYDLGFTEAAGNFQVNNLGRGGLGNDPVMAQAQDGAAFKDPFHVDNANMLTPPDGIPPRMQMYVFTGPNPDRDGDFDAEVMLHEYTHGLSHRLVGGGNGISGNALQTHGMGEGWSDFYALCVLSETSDTAIGNYAQGGYVTFEIAGLPFRENYYFGIRRYGYSTNLLVNPLTFKDIDPTQASIHPGIPRSPIFPSDPSWAPEVHNQGEVWCIALWEVRNNLIGRHGWQKGNRIAMQLVTDGMKLGPADPNFLQARDAILLADRVNNAGANYFEIWAGFAKRGMGGSATSPDSSTTVGVVEAYDMPGITYVSTIVDDASVGNANTAIDYNECVDLIVTLRNDSIASVTGVVAYLTVTNPAVTVIQGTVNYPLLPVNGTAVGAMPFRISTSSNFVCGTPIAVNLAVVAPFGVRTNTFWLETGLIASTPIRLNNNAALVILDANTNGVTSAINVSGFDTALGNVEVSLHLTHTADIDLALDLISPDGTVVNLVRNQGGSNDNYGVSCSPLGARTTFTDFATFTVAAGVPPFVGSFRPEQPLTTFKGKSGAAVNGQWRLRVTDSITNDIGTLQCWTLSLYPTICADGGGACAADIAVKGTVSPTNGTVGQPLNYSITVTNQRSIGSPAVVLTAPVPANSSLVSATSSQGSCSVVAGSVSCPLGNMNGNTAATVSIVLTPLSAGTLTASFGAAGGITDAVPANNTLTLVSSVSQPRPQIVAGNAAISAESFSPATGGIEAGETVTVNLTLHNVGTAPVTNLLCTLQAGAGVGSPSGSQNYGAIAPGGSATRAFTFTGVGAPGASILAVLDVQDGLLPLDDVTFSFGIGASGTFANTAPIVINEFGPSSPYPSTIDVTDLPGVISRVAVTLSKLSHAWPDDIDALLVGPLGQKLILMSDAGGGLAAVNRTLVFDAQASASVSDEAGLQNGTWLPTNFEQNDTFLAPAPAGPYGSALSLFNGLTPNGTWSLYIMDDSAPDVGAVSGGWSLDINTVIPVNPIANLAVTLAHPQPFTAGEITNYTITVVNNGPSAATNVVVSNMVPVASFAIDSVASTHGSASFNGLAVVGQIPSLPSGASAVITVTLHLNSATTFTNSAVVVSPVTDPDLSNNSVTAVVTPVNSFTDIGVAVTATPQPAFVTSNLTFHVTVTNLGPGRAWGVTVTNTLPAGWTFVSATNSKGSTTNEAGLVIATFGDMASGSSASAAITVNAGVAAVSTNSFGATTTTTDTNAANNVALVVATVSPRMPLLVNAGTAIIAEAAPADGGITAGETVTINFGLRNVGTRDAANLVATLEASGGVNPVTGSANFGAVVANGAVVSRTFTFTATGSGNVTATLRLQDGSEELGAVVFAFPLAVTTTSNSTGLIIIPQQGAANVYPSIINVAGLTGVVSKVTVTLNQLSHSFLADVDMLLVSPDGRKVVVLSDVGDSANVSGITVTLDDSAAARLPATGSLTSGTYHPTNYLPNENFDAPAPGGPYGRALADFIGANPNGAWSLFVQDDAGGDGGRIDGGWTLSIATVTPPSGAADVSVAGAVSGNSEMGSTLSYTLTVANNGPATASGVVLTDILPAGFALSGATVTQGTVINTGSGLSASIGTLNVGSTATVLITGTVIGANTLTNTAQVSAAQADPVLANNVAVQTTVIGSPALAIRQSGSNVIISWPAAAAGYILEASANPTGPWGSAGGSASISGPVIEVTVQATGAGSFYRLRRP